MTGQTDWTPALVALAVAAAAGAFVALRTWRAPPVAAPVDATGTDLERQRDALFQAIRELDGALGAMSPGDYRAERQRLELEAARTLRALERGVAAPAPVAPRAPGFAARHPQLVGALWGGGVIAFVAALYFGLQEATRPRAEGMTVTGNAQSGGPSGAMDDAAMQAAIQAELTAAKAEMEARPDDLDAKARYGFVVLNSGDVRGAFDVANQVVAVEGTHPLGRTLQGAILLEIGDLALATSVFDKVLELNPDTVPALEYRGVIHLQKGEREQALALWQKALQLDPSQGELLAPLIRLASDPSARLPSMAAADGAAAPAAPAGPAGSEANPSPKDVTGQLRLADGATPPPGGTLFLYARPDGVTAGPPAAARRFAGPTLPLDFRIGPGDSPMGGAFPDTLTLSARYDADGNAMTRGEGDLEGRVDAVTPGASGVVVVLAPRAP